MIMVTMIIVDDQPSVLDALRECLGLESDLMILGEAEDGVAAVELAQRLRPDVVLTDIKMPNMDGIAATAALQKIMPEAKVVILTIYDNETVRTQALAAGASAFVGKHEPAEVLLEAIHRVALGGQGLGASSR